MKEKNKVKLAATFIQYLLIIISAMLLIIFRETDITMKYICVCLMFLSNILFCIKKIKERILLFLFSGAFFTFLMGRELMNLLQDGTISYTFDMQIQSHIINSLYLSLFFLQIGFTLCEKLVKKSEPNEVIKFLKLQIKRESLAKLIKKYAKIVFIVGWILNIFVSIEQIVYVANYSYLEYSKSFVSKIPYIIRIVANFRTMAFFLFLTAMPNKKELRPILIMYILESLISLLYGNRGNCIINILIVVFYIVFRQYVNKKEKWITKKQVIIIIILIPFIFAFLSAFISYREGIDIGEITISSQIVRFFKSIGNSVNIIGYGKKYETQLNEISKLYVLGDIKQYILYNPIAKELFNMELAPDHTKEYALSGQSFMHTISYLIDSKGYIQGHGYGSSYIAELYADFGYIGIAIGNLLLGAYMAIFYKIYKKSFILTSCLLISYRIMFFIPRASFDYIITYVFNFTAIVSCIIILALSIGEIKIRGDKKNE